MAACHICWIMDQETQKRNRGLVKSFQSENTYTKYMIEKAKWQLWSYLTTYGHHTEDDLEETLFNTVPMVTLPPPSQVPVWLWTQSTRGWCARTWFATPPSCLCCSLCFPCFWRALGTGPRHPSTALWQRSYTLSLGNTSGEITVWSSAPEPRLDGTAIPMAQWVIVLNDFFALFEIGTVSVWFMKK